MNWQRLLLVVGAGATGLGILVLVAPEVLDIDVERTTLTLVAILALFLALWVVQTRRKTELEQASTPDSERILAVAPPGEELQDATKQFWRKPHAFYRLSGRDAIRAAAAAVLTRYENQTAEEATDSLDRGTWTEDPEAAQFLRKTLDPATSRVGSVRSWLGGESTYERRLRRSIDSIVALAGVQTEDTDDAPGWTSREGGEDEHATSTPSQTGLRASRQTGHWRGISGVVLVSVGVGVLLEQPAVLLVGVVGICYGAYARTHDVTPEALSIERSVADEEPSPGDEVEVTVRVRNDARQVLPDVRFVDGVPDALPVEMGSPRLGTALGPGQTVEVSYTVTARRGVHEFNPSLALVRNAPGTVEYEYALAPATATTLTCTPELQELPVPVPLRPTSTRYTGSQPTTASGNGTEFYATRLYQHGDDVNRIDWNRRAKTGELSTVLFREERTATVMLLVDTSLPAYVAPTPHGEHAVDRSVAAAGQAFVSIANDGHVVGIASLADADCWLEPGNGATHQARARDLLATHPSLQSVPSDAQENTIRARQLLQRRLSPNTQLVVFSPLCEQSIVRLVRRLEAAGYPVTVVSPDATASDTPSQRLARVGRRVQLTDLRRDGIPVVDWQWEESVAAALARYGAQEGSR